MLFREEQVGIKQVILMEQGAQCLTISKPHNAIDGNDGGKLTGVAVLRTVPGNKKTLLEMLSKRFIEGTSAIKIKK